MSRVSFLILWLGLILYSVFLAPDGNGSYLSNLLTMNDPDAGLLAMFSLLGVFQRYLPFFFYGTTVDQFQRGHLL
ncbi:hypothetical protein [Bacillus sp. N1-1]|uniref:hypothetical protein n=1 Tax=Bacillus sp. N1-1 TaxID=2682541 RepID=UPI00135C6930|nr:hypothetical protein [Bacillus sp. N1-1]